MVVRKNARAAEKAGQHHIPSSSVGGARSQQVRGYDSQQRPQLENIPTFAPEDGNRASAAHQRITFPRHGLDERGFPAAIRSKDAHVLASGNFQVHFVERDAVTARNRYVFEREKGWGHSAP